MGNNRCFAIWIAVIVGVILGIVTAALWIFGQIPFVTAMAPYAIAAALLIFMLTPILAICCAKPGIPSQPCHDPDGPSHGNPCTAPYVRVIMVSAAVFVVFVLILFGTTPPFVVNAILSFVGAISIWVTLLTFLAFVFDLIARRLSYRMMR